MIAVRMKMVVYPDGQVEFLRGLQVIMEAVRGEPGNIGCHLYQDINDKNIFTLVEEWESRADFNDHVRRDAFKMLFPLMDFMSEPLESKIDYVSDRVGMGSMSPMTGNFTDMDREPKRRWNFESPVLNHPSRFLLGRVFRDGFAITG